MAEWFDDDFLDYPGEFKEAPRESVKVSPNLSKTLTIHLSSGLLDELRLQAEKKGIGATTLARVRVAEHLKSG